MTAGKYQHKSSLLLSNICIVVVTNMETNRRENSKAVSVVIKQENPPRVIPSVESKQNQSCYWDRRKSPLWKAKLHDENPS
jgi:hypothetical protein